MHDNLGISVSTVAERIEEAPGLLTAPQLAELLNMARTTLYEMAANGRIPHIRIGSSIRFDPAATARWLRSREIATGRLPRSASNSAHCRRQDAQEAA